MESLSLLNGIWANTGIDEFRSPAARQGMRADLVEIDEPFSASSPGYCERVTTPGAVLPSTLCWSDFHSIKVLLLPLAAGVNLAAAATG
jgi:hypothetical protein